jgi:hypothetical protein
MESSGACQRIGIELKRPSEDDGFNPGTGEMKIVEKQGKLCVNFCITFTKGLDSD